MASQRTVSSLRACLRTTCRIWAHGRPAPHLLRSPRAPVRRSLCLVCLLTMLAAPEVEQSTIPEPQPSGSARITGRVLASGNGPPVRRGTRKALRERRRNEDRRFEARVCPERGGDGRQRRVRLRWSARWFVLHQRPGGENLAGKPLDFTGTDVIDDLLVVFTTEKAESEVTLTRLREVEVRVSR
jgi:hypothetical protein